MNECYCIKIKLVDDKRLPQQHYYAACKNELYISKSGRLAGLFGQAKLMQFRHLHHAELYIQRNRERFSKLYGSVLLHPVQHIIATS